MSKVAGEASGRQSAGRAKGALSTRRVLIATATGLAAGFLAGLFGVGGGVLIVPALVIVLGFGQRLAQGTSLAAIVPIAVVGVFGYARSGSVDWAAAVILAAAAAVGALIGTRWLHRLSQRALRLVFLAFLLVTALSLFRGVGSGTARTALDPVAAAGLAAIGLVAGVIAGLLGVGGGIVMVPALVLLLSVPIAVAKGTSLAVIVPTAVVGTTRNLRVRNADLAVAVVVGVTGTASSSLGSRLSVAMDPRLSKVLFACLLVAVAVTLLLRGGGGQE